MKELRIRYSRWMFFKSVVAPPFLFTAGVVAMVFVSGWLGGVCLAVSGAMLRWAVAKSFLADRPPLVFSPEGLLVAEMVNVGFTPWREVRALRVDVGANRLLCQVAKQGHWLAVVLDLGDYEIDDPERFRKRVTGIKGAAMASAWERTAAHRLPH